MVRLRRALNLSLALCLLLSGSASALTPDQQKLIKEGVNFFNIDSCSNSAVSSQADTKVSPGNIYIMGDSITELSKSAYTGRFSKSDGWDPTIEGLVSRHIVATPPSPGGLGQLKQDKAVIGKADAIVIALGTNDIGSPDSSIKNDVKQIMSELAQDEKKGARVFWVNTLDTRKDSATQQTNQDIADAVSGDAQMIDWYAEAKDKADTASFNGGVHPTKQKDINLLVNLVYDAVTGGSAPAAVPAAGCCDTGGTSTLSGKDNEEKVWNYFKGKGLSDQQVAGIMGNMFIESGFDPEIMQKNHQDSKDPYDAGDLGWGIIQWSGNGTTGRSTGDKFTKLYKESGVNGPVYELGTQLDLVWQHMNNHPDVTGHFDLQHFKQLTSASEAASYFKTEIEGGEDVGGVRESNATKILGDYQGTNSTPTSGASGGGSCTTSTATPDCQSATGNAIILCEAKKYDPVDYKMGGGHAGGAAYHKACQDIQPNDPSCALDCSGLVSVAVYDAFGNTKAWDTNSLRADTANWKAITWDQLQPGDVIEPDPGHVEIIDHVSGGTVYTFGAHTSNTAQPKQVGPVQYSKSPGYNYYRYVGQGAKS